MGARERGRPARCSRNVVARLGLLRVACQQRTGVHTRKRKRQRPSCSLGGAPTKQSGNRPRASGSVVWGCLPASTHAFVNVLGRLGQGRGERAQTLQPSDNGGGMDLGDPAQQRAYSLHPPTASSVVSIAGPFHGEGWLLPCQRRRADRPGPGRGAHPATARWWCLPRWH